ncbi:hypothetical protein B0F90DRAFT_1622260 [Multifurca ochricompacta]|uniref:Yeast cell wall synthesis Kre9/Knh1-like N-terminal domain-containing protein n=1 Tax=Multifurca ochricompacta TaxID=376703 RepID=A0AAD4MAN4_9AGAM|nr:hypothetical protein B0F90DRAFT_1622260 [Multifurca ochricompacta]
MHILFTLLSLIASAYAYQVITPGGASGWTTAGPNVVTWQRVDTDPRNFTILLVNQVGPSASSPPPPLILMLLTERCIMPLGSQVLAALVDGTLDTFTVSPPSTGYPTGTGFRVNLVVDSEHLDSILAQSQQFSIVQPNTTASVTRTIA